MAYIDPSTVSDEGAVAEATLTGVADRVPGWVPYEGHTEVALAESVGIAIATAVTALKATVRDAYVGFGQRVLGIPKIRAAAAETTATVVLTDAQNVVGLEIPVGAEIYAITPANDTIVFYTSAGTTVAPSQGTAVGVPLIAQLTGPEANDTTGDATSNLSGVQQITFEAPAAGGVDEEADDSYANRLSQRTPRMHVLPVTVADYAELARDVPGVSRAWAVNVYDPSAPGTVSPGHLTIVGLQADGGTLTPTLETALTDYLDVAERPLSVELHTLNPVWASITVVATVRLAQVSITDLGTPVLADPDAVTSLAEGAVASLLDPAKWDVDPNAPGGWSLIPARELTIFDVAEVIEQVPGVSHVATCLVNGGTAPISLPEPMTMPDLLTVTVTVAPDE